MYQTIVLMYIKGISLVDTPLFFPTSQDKYFDSKAVITFDSDSYNFFYPPFYDNEIILNLNEDDLFSLNSKSINYLYLTFANKRYYYFINSVKYIAEDKVKLNISMDTIQTYLSNIKIRSGLILHESIKRWNLTTIASNIFNKINRNYFRENLAEKDDMLIYKYKDYNENSNCSILGHVYNAFSGEYSSAANYVRIGFDYDNPVDKDLFLKNNLKYIENIGNYVLVKIFPDLDLTNVIRFSDINLDGTETVLSSYSLEEYYSFIGNFVANPNIREANVVLDEWFYNLPTWQVRKVPNDKYDRNEIVQIIKDIKFIFEHSTFEGNPANTNGKFSRGLLLNITSNTGSTKTSSVKIKLIKDNYDFGFEVNKDPSVIFNSKFVPQMLDENYIDFKFGERMQLTSYPLSKSVNSSLVLAFYFNPVDYTRNYCIYTYNSLGDQTYNNIDNYMTYVSANSIETFELINDAYTNYISQNKATLTEGIALAKQQNIVNAVLSGTKAITSGSAIGAIAKNPIIGTIGTVSSLSGTIAKATFNDYVIEKQNEINLEDKKFTPDTTRQGNNFSSDLIANTLHRISSESRIKNFSEIALSMEKRGYLTKRNVINFDWINKLNYRYYYNVYQFDNLILDLENCVSSTELIQEIKSRFSLGFRGWNITHLQEKKIEIGNFIYDNVENDFIKKEA